MDKENLISIHSGDVLTKEQTKLMYEFAKDFEKLGYTHEESAELAKAAIQPTTFNIEEIEKIVDKFCSIPTVNPISAEDLKKVLERSENGFN